MSATPALAAPVEPVDGPVSPSTPENGGEAINPHEGGASGSRVPRLEPGNQAESLDAREVGAAHPTSERDQAIARIRQSTLPPGLRDRLAAVVEAGQNPRLDVSACLQAIEQSLPDFLRDGRQNISRPQHPAGDAFFNGSEELTDAEAETLAQGQLARSGLLRGQRVKVGG